jgi:hypothetical protein
MHRPEAKPPPLPPHRLAEGLERFDADVVLDALGVDAGGFLAHAERNQEGDDGLVALAAFLRDLQAGLGQKDAAIALAGDEALGGQAGEHLGDRRLGDAEAGGDVDLARLVAVLDEVGDQLDVILDQRVAARLAGLAKAFRVHFRVGQRLAALDMFACRRQGPLSPPTSIALEEL